MALAGRKIRTTDTDNGNSFLVAALLCVSTSAAAGIECHSIAAFAYGKPSQETRTFYVTPDNDFLYVNGMHQLRCKQLDKSLWCENSFDGRRVVIQTYENKAIESVSVGNREIGGGSYVCNAPIKP